VIDRKRYVRMTSFGLVNEANPCRCAKKTQGFMKAGFLDEMYAEIHRNHPFHDPPDFVTSLRNLINGADFKSTLELE
jgi:hypothetical protein